MVDETKERIRLNRYLTPALLGGTGFRLDTFSEGSPPAQVAAVIAEVYPSLFGLGEGDALVFVDAWAPAAPEVGALVLELQQRHAGLDVEAATLTVVLDANNDVIRVFNRTIPDLALYAPTPLGEENEVYYPAEDACERISLAFRSSVPATGGDVFSFHRAADGQLISKVFVASTRTPGEMPPVITHLAPGERTYPIAGLPRSLAPLATKKRISLFPTDVVYQSKETKALYGLAHMMGEVSVDDYSHYSANAPQLFAEHLFTACDLSASPTITRVWGHPNPPTSDPEGIYERGSGWGTTEIPSRYAVVKLEVSGFNKDKPPVLVVRDESASGAPIVEKIWWGGLATETGNPTDGYIVEAPVVLAGDPDPWDDPAKGGDPAERVSRIELLHCGQVVDSVTIRLIKSTRWPGFPAIGVHVVPAVWHDVRRDQAETDVAALRSSTINGVYRAFFTPARQDIEVTNSGAVLNYKVQKVIGQARAQIRLLALRLHSVYGTERPDTCCLERTCLGSGGYMSWGGGLGDAGGIDIYDVFVVKEYSGTTCDLVTSGYAAKKAGLITLSRFGNVQSFPKGQPPYRTSALDVKVVCHELGHLLFLFGHASDNTHLMGDPITSGFCWVLPQDGNQGIAQGRENLSDEVLMAPSPRNSPSNRYLQEVTE